MRNCVLYCKNPKKLHVFPDETKCPKRRRAWIKRLCVNKETEFRKLFACDKHFSAGMFRGSRLWNRALPDINLPPKAEPYVPEPEERNGYLLVPDKFVEPQSETERLQLLILNTQWPIVLRNFENNWCCFNDTLEEWCNKLDAECSEPLCFERTNKCGSQWERQRFSVQMSAANFLKDHSVEQTYWTGFNYKRAHELPAVCSEGIDFSCFGFTRAADDCTFWLSSKGANTPCHYDAYGCNIVTQIYGSKMWLLFPPDASLTPTRIPYEESSIYCTENFYAPNPKELENYTKLQNSAYKCILKPKDVLIVPRHWWHYVETLETSLSVNSWIPLRSDVESQLDECIVKCLIEGLIKNDETQVVQYTLNPNELLQISEESDIFAIMNYLLKILQDKDFRAYSKNLQHLYAYQYLKEKDVRALYNFNFTVEEVLEMSGDRFMRLLHKHAARFDENTNQQDISPMEPLKEILLNTICSPRIIDAIKTEFLARFQSASS